MGQVGLEPTRPCGHQILSLTSLPIPSLAQNPFYTEREKRGGFSVPKQSTVGLTCYHECFCFVLCAYFNVSSQSSIFFLIAIPDGIQTNITHINPQGDGKKYAERNDNTIAIISMPNIIQKNLDFHHLIQVAIYILKNNY